MRSRLIPCILMMTACWAGSATLARAGKKARAELAALTARAEAGDAAAQFELGSRYDLGMGVDRRIESAVEWYRRSAEQGNAQGENAMGHLHFTGDGVPQDDAKAIEWWRKAAEKGDDDALCSLGYMYEEGRGVKEDDAQAVALYRRAIDAGSTIAMSNLGIMIANGTGIEQDPVEGYAWIWLATTLTNSESDMSVKWRIRGALDDLGRHLTPKDVRDGQTRSQAIADEVDARRAALRASQR